MLCMVRFPIAPSASRTTGPETWEATFSQKIEEKPQLQSSHGDGQPSMCPRRRHWSHKRRSGGILQDLQKRHFWRPPLIGVAERPGFGYIALV